MPAALFGKIGYLGASIVSFWEPSNQTPLPEKAETQEIFLRILHNQLVFRKTFNDVGCAV